MLIEIVDFNKMVYVVSKLELGQNVRQIKLQFRRHEQLQLDVAQASGACRGPQGEIEFVQFQFGIHISI